MRVRFCSFFRLTLLSAGIGSAVMIPVQASASTDDDELALIKKQILSLEKRVVAIEQRRNQRLSPKTRSQTASAQMSHDGQHAPATKQSALTKLASSQQTTSRAAQGASGPQAGLSAPPTLLAAQGGSHPPSGIAPVSNKDADSTASSASAIDLSSSSPLAITQTAVDHLQPVFSIGNISVRLAGFVELSNVWRSSNLTSGPATAWGAFPYANSPNHNLSEERLSSQLSRLSTLLEANPTSAIRLQAYIESDFAGSAGTTNSVQINGYTPRLRQGYFTFSQKDWGFHVLMGQAWSLATPYAKGVQPRNEQLPAVSDNNQIPGITFTRVPQIRIGKSWAKRFWLALSIEDPQATVAYSSSFASGDRLPAVGQAKEGPRIFYSNSGGLLLNPNAQYTDNPAPDIILKTAVDTNLGHYELFGLGRWFRTVIQSPGATTTHRETRFGGGVGGGMTLQLFTPKLQLTGNVLAGKGIGRYGAGQLPDTTFNSQGELDPLPGIHGALGLIGHPSKSVLVYLYGGAEASGRRQYFGADGKQYGYGVNDLNLAGCAVEFGTCSAQTRTLASATAGGWWHFLDGSYGSLMGGLQYTYVRKFAFRGNDGKGTNVYPAATGNVVYVTFRYLPFQ